jgi:hypothetical protein
MQVRGAVRLYHMINWLMPIAFASTTCHGGLVIDWIFDKFYLKGPYLYTVGRSILISLLKKRKIEMEIYMTAVCFLCYIYVLTTL